MSTFPTELLADALREARELMNDSGAHWIQGASVQPLEKHDDDGSVTVEYAYCSWGAVSQIAVDFYRRDAIAMEANLPFKEALMIALAKDEEISAVELAPLLDGEIRSEADAAYGKVVAYNDAPERTWKDIEGAFRRAEQRLRGES